MANPQSTSGWSKDLSNLPTFWDAPYRSVKQSISKLLTTIKKNFKQGEQTIISR